MTKKLIIRNAEIVNEGQIFIGDLSIENSFISEIKEGSISGSFDTEIDATGLTLIPGMIDDQVHFREPGLTHKANIFSESRAAVAGGITSFMEMPNTVPNTVTQELLENKYSLAKANSAANYSFFMGANNENLDEVLKTNQKDVCGIKVFMGSSTGNMLVDNKKILSQIFEHSPMLIATHCEDEMTIRRNMANYKEKYGEEIPFDYHPLIRSVEACYLSSSLAVDLAKKFSTRLHILHISTEKELSLFNSSLPLEQKKITAECCIHHLWFNDSHYSKKGSLIKWNPAVKKESDRKAIISGIQNNVIDIIATDHAPHTIAEKNNNYCNAPSGGPLVQHAVLALMDLVKKKEISLTDVVRKTSHDVAKCFKIEKRGFLRPGYNADLVLINRNKEHTVNKNNLLYKCGWSPFEGHSFSSTIDSTIINGEIVFKDGKINESFRGERLKFDR
ncbi:MAG: dihydroorotase [Crocinitomicaceae bacterium]|nr:dihydroorotase [Crocinitomicaceae bacterium]